eukprot:7641352-Heterocapsa_arctica.AAC.1
MRRRATGPSTALNDSSSMVRGRNPPVGFGMFTCKAARKPSATIPHARTHPPPRGGEEIQVGKLPARRARPGGAAPARPRTALLARQGAGQ